MVAPFTSTAMARLWSRMARKRVSGETVFPRESLLGWQNIHGWKRVTGKFGLGTWKEAGPRLIEFCQENAVVIANPLPTTQEKTLYMDITRWSTPKSD